MAVTMAGSAQEEFSPATTKVHDIREVDAKRDGIFVIGGLVGELIITFTCLLDYILANPANINFQFTMDTFEAFFKDFLITEGFADNAITLHLEENPLKGADGEDAVIEDDTFARHSLQPVRVSDYGLAFLLGVQRDLVLNNEFMMTMYKVISRIVKLRPKELVPVPEMPGPDAEGNEAPEEERAAIQKQIDEAQRVNADVEKHNADVNAIQSKVRVVTRPALTEVVEVALMRVGNYRENKPEGDERSSPELRGGDENILENFAIEEIPTKMILVDQRASEDTHMIVYHHGKHETLIL